MRDVLLLIGAGSFIGWAVVLVGTYYMLRVYTGTQQHTSQSVSTTAQAE